MSKKVLFLIPFCVILFFKTSNAQRAAEREYRINQTIPLLVFLDSLEQHHPIRFFCLEEWLRPHTIKPDPATRTLGAILKNTLEESNIDFVFLNEYAVLFFKDATRDIERQHFINRAIRENRDITKLQFGTSTRYLPGTKLTLKGTLRDESSKDPIVGATVFINELNYGVSTSAEGAFELVLPGNDYLLELRSLNYETKIINVSLYENAQATITLAMEPTMLKEITISDQFIVNRRVGQTTLDMSDLKRAPAFLGEADLIKQIQTQSGVTTASEASSGFNVRGGGVDQNLVLYDGVAIFNTAHALGFFTAFNSDAIRSASFYKGGVPAEFGGRASSVLDISSKEGNYKKWSAGGGIGLVSSTLQVEGPIKKDTSSLFISARSTYSDWILDLLETKYADIQNGSVFFYDGSLKYTHKLNKKSKIIFSSYTSQDKFKLSNDTLYQWQNLAFSLKYDHNIRQNLSYTAGLSFGRYNYTVQDTDAPTAFDLNYRITYPSVKLDFNRTGTIHKQTFGLQSTYYGFSPGNLKPTSPESSVKSLRMRDENAIETSLYASNEFRMSEKLNLELGLRLTMFNRIGPGVTYLYEAGTPIETRNIVDSTVYGVGEFMKTYFGPEPRLTLQYTINTQSSFKFGYNRLYQYVHLISNTTSITPVDIWQSSNQYFKPQRADQVSVGYFRSSKNNQYEISGEVFYKHLNNILDFKDGANLILNKQLETSLVSGTGKAYGAEFMINKLHGRLTGGFNYTYSRSLRRVEGDFDVESVNDGKTYAASFDQPNIVNVNWRYAFVKRFFFSGTFTYHTGRPVSLPLSAYGVDNVWNSEFSDRNTYRIPDYHRVDIAFILEPGHKKKKLISGTWTFSLYNLYGRKNPYSVYFVDKGSGILQPYQLSLIGTVVPSMTYSFKL